MKLRVREIIKEQGLTLVQLSKRMGVLPESLTRMLSMGNPTLSTIENIANSLDVPISELFDEENETGKKVRGYIEIDDVIHKITSKNDLEKLYKQLSKK